MSLQLPACMAQIILHNFKTNDSYIFIVHNITVDTLIQEFNEVTITLIVISACEKDIEYQTNRRES